MNHASKEILRFQLTVKRREYLAALKNAHRAYEREPERHWFQSYLESKGFGPYAGPTGKLRINQGDIEMKAIEIVGRMVRWATDLKGPEMDPLEAHARTVESLRFVELENNEVEWSDIVYHKKT